jgi:WD40 repeat protein
MATVSNLKIKSLIGFSGKILLVYNRAHSSSLIYINISGKVYGALNYTPCGKYIIYPLGSFVVFKDLRSGRESFLDGHTYEVSCISISKDGERLASGQSNISGVKVAMITSYTISSFNYTSIFLTRLM